ncbi:unnamed protein product [Rangifer tarandus platyrhynchus]|uniref:Uncharacterized protein n=1 Tax=Rangifer tarandus platyrhynchus TaxID=3082113 RepID=A0AC59YBM1_RANTA
MPDATLGILPVLERLSPGGPREAGLVLPSELRWREPRLQEGQWPFSRGSEGGPFVRRCGCLICHLPLLIGPRPLDSYFPWKMDVDSALWAENAAPAGPLAESSQRTWMLRGEPGNGEAALQGLDASAECRFSLCYCTPCQADFFLSEKFKAKTRI